MAIQFARSERVSRGKGGNAVRSAAYAMRAKLYDERTGETHKFKDDGTLQHAGILLVDGTDPDFLDPAVLFNAIEAAEKRKDAQVAQHVVLALDPSISPAERVEMANGFGRQLFVDRGKPVLVCIHEPHSGENPHAHLIGGTRRLGPDGFAPHKDRETTFARVLGRAAFILQSERERVGELWANFQNAWFEANGKGITVDPVGPIPQEHIGPVRFRHPRDPRIAANTQVRELNVKIASDPRVHNLKREALTQAAWSDKVQSGLRPLSVEDVARELSIKYGRRAPDTPTYAELLDQAKELREDARKADWIRRQQTADKEAGEHRVNERWSEMGIARRALHLVGTAFPSVSVLRDIELDRWRSLNKQGARAEERWAIRGAAISGGAFGAPAGDLQVVMRQAAVELDKIRPAAERELAARQKVARNAREALANLEQRDKLVRRARRSISM